MGDISDTSDVLSVVNVTYTVDTVVTPNGGVSPPPGLSRSSNTLSVDPADAAFESLAAGVEKVIVVSYDVSDGLDTVAQKVDITITGTNDAPIIVEAVVTRGAVKETR